jgi:hypothetical protein
VSSEDHEPTKSADGGPRDSRLESAHRALVRRCGAAYTIEELEGYLDVQPLYFEQVAGGCEKFCVRAG